MRTSQYGAPTTSTAASNRLYSAISTHSAGPDSTGHTNLALPPASAKMIINDCMSTHRNRPARIPHATRIFAALAFALSANVLHASDKSAPPAKPATEYVAHETHPNEHVTVAAEPCDDAKDCSFFRLKYLEHGLLPIRVIITNDSDHALSLDDARMQFISAENDKVPAATTDDINRRLFTIKNAQGTKIPIIPITVHHPVDKKILQDDQDFGFKSTTVKPHSTLAGYLFYDVKQLDEPALAHAEFYVKMIHTADDKQELFAFSIPFDKWLAANPDAPSNHPRR
jgi:hypothetical protein